MPTKLKILVSVYACAPNRGSEPGMGWNFVLGLSKYHNVHVISEELKWKEPIKIELQKNPDLSGNLKFYFIKKKRNKALRKIWPPSYYWYYNRWQKKVFQLAKELDKQENFDIIHQLNMVGFREPGYLWNMNKPFVWGPIGGLENSPWRFLPSLGFKGLFFYSSRNLINILQRNFLPRPKKAANHKPSVLITATPDNAYWIKKIWNKEAAVISEVGQEITFGGEIKGIKRIGGPLRIIWSGLHTPRKNLPLLLKSLSQLNFLYECHILGSGEMTKKWQEISRKLGIDQSCMWYGWLDRTRALEIMQTGHVFCITSISDLTSTVTLEALSCGLPIICLDHCGFSHVINQDCGIKIPVTSPRKASSEFAVALEKMFYDEQYRQRLSAGATKRASDFSWEKKIETLNSIYSSLLEG